MMAFTKATFTLLLSLVLLQATNAEIGFVDDTFNCPATVQCPILCAASLDACPPELQSCPDNQNLCADGSCSEEPCDESIESPCVTDLYYDECAPVSCRVFTDLYDNCGNYKTFYEAAANCTVDDDTPPVDETSAGFVFFYTWFAAVTVILYLAAAVFRRCVSGAIRAPHPLEEAGKKNAEESSFHDETDEKKISSSKWTQAAYRTNLIGDIVYILVLLSLAMIQALLALFTILYYQTEGLILTQYDTVFTSDIQVLKWFEIVWMFGFFWTFILKWPGDLRSLFYQHCDFSHATHISVFTPSVKNDLMVEKSQFRSLVDCIQLSVNKVFAFIFSDVTYNPNGKYTYCPVSIDPISGSKLFYFRQCRYILNSESGLFEPGSVTVGTSIGDLMNAKGGLTSSEVQERTAIVGTNTIPFKKPSLIRSIIDTYKQPFYTYQNFMVWTWFPFYYYYMAFIHTVVRVGGGLVTGYFQYRAMRNLYQMTQTPGCVLSVLRDGEFIDVSSNDLVPGDVVRVKPGSAVVDMVILSSEHILVDESTLTGESQPVHKVELERDTAKETYDASIHRKNTIMAGTTILETSGKDTELAIVMHTGSYTAKGALLRDILSYERNLFKFDIEVQLVVLILLLYAIFAFSMTVYFLQEDPIYAWFYGMYVFGTALPPLIPTVFVVSVGVSDERLNRKNIVSTDPNSILVAGKVNIAFFDKTGTLTQEGLSFHSILDVKGDSYSGNDLMQGDQKLITVMGVCNSLVLSLQGDIVGNTLEKTMFSTSGAELSSSGGNFVVSLNGEKLTIVKRFTFDHHRMTQSVIVQDSKGQLKAYVKGSSESIAKICMSKTIPSNFDPIVATSSSQGLYQIAVAMKDVSSANLDRNQVEKDLTFIGFVNFKNELKHESAMVLEELYQGSVRSIMVTGDALFTGIHVAKECGLIRSGKTVIYGKSIDASGDITWLEYGSDKPSKLPSDMSFYSLAVSGDVWAALVDTSSNLFDLGKAGSIAPYLSVVGRCSPLDKVLVVDYYVKEGYITMMCGDGGNDCGALKIAHVGLALSDSEASLVSPFTSTDRKITAALEILKEGRCALASALGSFKYMIMYGQVESINQMINAYFAITFSEWCWVFMDGLWMVTMAFTIPLSKPAKKLASVFPTSSLFGIQTLNSVLGILFINFIFTVIALGTLFGQSWFNCRTWEFTSEGVGIGNILVIGDNYESETLFLVTGFQYIISAAVYTFGSKFRLPWYTNYWFVFFATLWTTLHFVATLVPSGLSCLWRVNCTNENAIFGVTDPSVTPINNVFNTTVMPVDYRWYLILIMVSNFVAISLWEGWFVNGVLANIVNRRKN